MFKYWLWGLLIILLLFGSAVYHWMVWQPQDTDIDLWAFIDQLWPDEEAAWRLKLDYQHRPLTILLVPGHDPEFYGASFGDLTEAELNLALAEDLYQQLIQADNFIPIVARDLTTGNYIPAIKDYWQEYQDDILSYRQDLIGLRLELLGRGDMADWALDNFDQDSQEIAFRLYGLNRWAREEGFDLILHLHFNDYFGRPADQAGIFSGSAIYVPDSRFPNAGISRAVAESIFAALTEIVPPSNSLAEVSGIIDSQHLAAVAADPSPYAASILIEYGYIYESAWADPVKRQITLPLLAEQTVAGLLDFFNQ